MKTILYCPLWQYILIFVLLELLIFNLINLILWLLLSSFGFSSWLSLIVVNVFIVPIFFIIALRFVWTHYINVKPSASFAFNFDVGPWIHLVENASSSIVINWFTKKAMYTELLFGDSKNSLKPLSHLDFNYYLDYHNAAKIGSAKNMTQKPVKMHRVYLFGLDAGKIYFYRIPAKPFDSKIYSFKTANLKPTTVKFAVVGDTQNGGGFGDPNWSYPKIISSISENDIDLLLHVGDATDQGNDLKSWYCFLKTSSKVASRIPMLIAVGNHDTGTQYLQDKLTKKYPDEGANFDYFLGYKYDRQASEDEITSFQGRYFSTGYGF